MICKHCNGYGSSLKDPIGVDRCSVCGGTGLVCAHCLKPIPGMASEDSLCPDCTKEGESHAGKA